MLAVVKAVKDRSDDYDRESSETFWEVAESVDDGGHHLQSRRLLVDIVGLQILFGKQLHDLVDLSQVLPVGIFGYDDFDVLAGRLPLFLASTLR